MRKFNEINSLFKAKTSDVSVRVKKSWRGIEYQHLKKVRRRRDRKIIPSYPNCKNCGEPLQGIYCHRCGQYALDINQPFGRYIIEYFSNAYQYDGRLLSTLRLLFLRPGRLTSEFEAGRINSYAHPLKLYMFISIVFFGVILAFVPALHQEDYLTSKVREKDSTLFVNEGVAPERVKDSLSMAGVIRENVLKDLEKELKKENITPAEARALKKLRGQIALQDQKESVDQSPVEDGEAPRKISQVWKILSTETQQTVPLVMMCLLPIYAAILRFFYRKRKKKYLLCFVYSIHIQSLMLLLIALLVIALVFCPVMWINSALLWTFSIYFLFYLMISSHNFFREKWWKSVIKGPLAFGTYFFICFLSIMIVFLIKMVKSFS